MRQLAFSLLFTMIFAPFTAQADTLHLYENSGTEEEMLVPGMGTDFLVDPTLLLPADEMAQLMNRGNGRGRGRGRGDDDHWDNRRPAPRPAPRSPYPRSPAGKLVCYAQDSYGYRYAAFGYDPYETQSSAMFRCQRSSFTYCYSLGCSVYSGRRGD